MLLHPIRLWLPLWIFLGTAALPLGASAKSFLDVPKTHPAYEAITSLTDQGILKGYQDGRFHPNQPVNRAEAVRMMASEFSPEYIEAFSYSTVFSDVPNGAWYLPYVEIARQNGAIDSPPKSSLFYGERQVTNAEFVKIFLILKRRNIHLFEQEQKPLAPDVSPGKWFYPYLTLALSMNMIQTDAVGNLLPEKALSRADAAVLLHRYAQYASTQALPLLIDAIDENLHKISAHRTGEYTPQAPAASFRAILLAHGLRSLHDSLEHQALQKITWAAGKLLKGEPQEAQKLMKEAKMLSPATVSTYGSSLTRSLQFQP